jgi:hypothetical protein
MVVGQRGSLRPEPRRGAAISRRPAPRGGCAAVDSRSSVAGAPESGRLAPKLRATPRTASIATPMLSRGLGDKDDGVAGAGAGAAMTTEGDAGVGNCDRSSAVWPPEGGVPDRWSGPVAASTHRRVGGRLRARGMPTDKQERQRRARGSRFPDGELDQHGSTDPGLIESASTGWRRTHCHRQIIVMLMVGRCCGKRVGGFGGRRRLASAVPSTHVPGRRSAGEWVLRGCSDAIEPAIPLGTCSMIGPDQWGQERRRGLASIRWTSSIDLLIRGFGVRVPGGAPVIKALTWHFPPDQSHFHVYTGRLCARRVL